jgi:hypothetical protein
MSVPDVADDRVEQPSTPTRDPHTVGRVIARLGRPPSDVLEATIVLEAWDGRPVGSAMSAARELINPNGRPTPTGSRVDPPDDSERRSVIGEGIALVLSILSVAAWARPLSRELGPQALEDSIRVALPVAVALQWVLRSRYLSRRHGLALVADDALACCTLLVLLELPLFLLPSWGPVAALLILIWVGGTIVTRRGWGLLYALALVVGTATLEHGHEVYRDLGILAGLTTLLCVAAILTRRGQNEDRPGGLPRGLLAGLIGGGVGVLLVGDPSLGWGVHGVHPAIALVPSVLGSFWGGYYLWNLYEALPRGLSRVPLERASRAGPGGPAMKVFLGALLRLLGTTIAASAVVVALGPWTEGTDATSVFIAFACAALVSMILSLLVHWYVPGGALAAGATVGVLLTLPAVLALLSRPGRVLATTLWIK